MPKRSRGAQTGNTNALKLGPWQSPKAKRSGKSSASAQIRRKRGRPQVKGIKHYQRIANGQEIHCIPFLVV